MNSSIISWVVDLLNTSIQYLFKNPLVVEFFRFAFFGAVIEGTRFVGQKALESVKHYFVVSASFTREDLAFDWVNRYFEDHQMWGNSHVVQVIARKPRNQNGSRESEEGKGKDDGRLRPFYRAGMFTTEMLRWKGYWMTVNIGTIRPGTVQPEGSVDGLTISIWTRDRNVLYAFVDEARNHYFESSLPPSLLEQNDSNTKATESEFITARISQNDPSYNWVIGFLRKQEGYEDSMARSVTTKTSTQKADSRARMALEPAIDQIHRVRWRDCWLQYKIEREQYDRVYGLRIIMHNSKRDTLQDFIEAAREDYSRSSLSTVTVYRHEFATWSDCIVKEQRKLDSIILPEGVKERILNDARDFLDSEVWYHRAGVPHRRGYLLYGKPGTGKSSTAHAIAGELKLDIYYLQLSSRSLDDDGLYRLISSAPSRCIMLIEDIDCAIRSRADEEEEDEEEGTKMGFVNYQSKITLSGLLNALDSVTAAEGRITIATTNHIERLDPALIRVGRMDMKIEYKLATSSQIQQAFYIFFSPQITDQESPKSDNAGSDGNRPEPEIQLAAKLAELGALAESFAKRFPQETFSPAEIQGYLVLKRKDAHRAVADADAWIADQLAEMQRLQDLKDKRWEKLKERTHASVKTSRDPAGKEAFKYGNSDADASDWPVTVDASESDKAVDMNAQCSYSSVGIKTAPEPEAS